MATVNKFHASVYALIEPICRDMTYIYMRQQTNPLLGPHNEPEQDKLRKRDCVHFIFKNGELDTSLVKTDDGKLVCQACGREVAMKFNKEAVDTLAEATKIINQLVFFGMNNGLRADRLNTLIQLKHVLPDAAQLLAELNEFVKRDEGAKDSESNLAKEYQTPIQQFTRSLQ